MNEMSISLKVMIDNKAPEIIALVNKFADQHYKTIIAQREVKKQFVDLLEASAQICCIDELKLYIKYKSSKEGTRSLWGNLATPLCITIDELIDNVASDIAKDEQFAKDKTIKAETINIEVLKRFCGYLMWREHADVSEKGAR